jgi:predicted PurR-regulated permease PerM
MSEHRHIPEPGELIHLPRPSWGPAFFALGAIGLVCGIYAGGFIFAPFIYAIVGAILVLAAFRNLARGALRDYFRLPRSQHVRSAALPVETITVPPKP